MINRLRGVFFSCILTNLDRSQYWLKCSKVSDKDNDFGNTGTTDSNFFFNFTVTTHCRNIKIQCIYKLLQQNVQEVSDNPSNF